MPLSVFEDKFLEPSDEEVTKVLGKSRVLWDDVKTYIAENYNPVNEEWKNYGKASGWTLLTKQKKRTLLYLFPSTEYFIAKFVFGEKAVEKALSSKFPLSIIASIKVISKLIERARLIGIEVIRIPAIYKYNERSRTLFLSFGFIKVAQNQNEESYELKLSK